MWLAWFGGLRARLVALILVAFIPLVVLEIHTIYEQRRFALHSLQEDLFQVMQPISARYEQVISGARKLLIVLAESPAVRSQDPAATSALFAKLTAQAHIYADIGAVKPNGEVFAIGIPGRRLPNVAKEVWFQHAVDTRDFSVGNYWIDSATDKAAVNVAFPVLSASGEVESILFIAIDLTRLNDIAMDARLRDNYTLTIIDSEGVILVRSPNPERWVGTSISGQELGRRILSQGTGLIETAGDDGARRIYAFMPLGSTTSTHKAYLAIGVSTDVVYAEANALLIRNLVLLGIVLALTCLAAWIGGNKLIVRKVDALSGAADRLGTGDLDTQTGLPHTSDELGRLAQRFDEMACSIKTLTHLNSSILSSAGEGICGMDMQCNVTFLNAAGASMLGRTVEECIGRPLHALAHHTRPDGADFPLEECPSYLTLHNGTSRRLRDEVFWRKDGTSFFVDYVSSPIWENGDLVGAVVVFRDVTERRLLEDQTNDFYRRTILAATEGKLVVCDQSDIVKIAGIAVASFDVGPEEDWVAIRRAIHDTALHGGMDDTRIRDLVLCVGEATTNAIKHAGGGTASLHRVSDGLMLVVSDVGPGILTMNLPEVALKRGYTTAVSLGMGYKVMISLADRVYLATGPEGTTVGIVMMLHAPEAVSTTDVLPETW